ncbi:MAG: GntR family transcriptional regulator [Cellulosilyticaceae bacterium]
MQWDQIEFDSNEPIYLQIVALIRRGIALGEIHPGDKLPSVREMSTRLGVNPNTMQRAYGELERLEITYTKRGMGSFVSEMQQAPDRMQEDMGRQLAQKFLGDMKAIGIGKKEAMGILEEIEA